MKTIPFYPCQMCKYSEEEKYVPSYHPNSSQKYRCEKASNGIHKNPKKLENCELSGADKNSVFCYKCRKGFI